MAKNIYNKGRYKPEWFKHLRPFLKRVGNKRWRKDAVLDIQNADEELLTIAGKQSCSRKRKKPVKVKFTMKSAAGFTHTYYASYTSLKEAKQALIRNAVGRAVIFERKGKIIGQYERDDTKQVAANRK